MKRGATSQNGSWYLWWPLRRRLLRYNGLGSAAGSDDDFDEPVAGVHGVRKEDYIHVDDVCCLSQT